MKTLLEKEKLLITSNFSFSHSVFKRLVFQGRQKVSLCGNGLTLYQATKILTLTKLKAFADDKFIVAKMMISVFWIRKYCEKKEKMLVTNISSFSYNVFKRFLFQGHYIPGFPNKGLTHLQKVSLHDRPGSKVSVIIKFST